LSPAGKPQGPLIALSTASVFPDRTPDAFEMAARLGYDGIEVMVSSDAVSQDVDVLRRLVDYHGIPVLAVHAPCLLVTQRVWGREPWGKLTRAAAVAEKLGARVVVVHPPFRWQRDYAREFEAGLARMRDETDVVFAVENMFPLRAGGAEVAPYSPHWNPVPQDYPAVTLDLSHASVSGSDAMAMAADLGSRLSHIHLADGTGLSNRDEHLVPGRGTQPCGEILQKVAADGYTGAIVLEVNTRRASSREARSADLAEALEFTRRHLAQNGTGGTRAAQPAHAGAAAAPAGSQPRKPAAGGRQAASRPRSRGTGSGEAGSRRARGQDSGAARADGTGSAPGHGLAGAGQGHPSGGSALALRRWRRLDGQARREASFRS
jgi:sugar phosphate isomerase/epimerase